MLSNNVLVFRLILAAIIGGFIGMEREVHNRPAGFRTHILVAVGSALITLISKDAFYGLGDPSRIAAQIVTGIGFLGAGTIIKTGNNIKGLTTAASLWVSAGIGISIGAGYYLAGITTSGIVLLTLINIGNFEKRLISKTYNIIKIFAEDRNGLLGEIGTILGQHQIYVEDIKVIPIEEEDNLNELVLEFRVNLPRMINLEILFNHLLKIENISMINFNERDIISKTNAV